MGDLFHDIAAAARFGPEKMTKVNLFESSRMFCDLYCLEPGQRQKDHVHNDNDKIYHLVTGTCTVRIGDERRRLAAGQTAIAPAGVVHGLENDTDVRATLLVVMAPHPSMPMA